MKADVFYGSAAGRFLMMALQKTGLFRLAAWAIGTRMSKPLIRRYIEKNGIDMSAFKGQSYDSFSEFFSRKRDIRFDPDPDALISPCDSLLSVYGISDGLIIPIKGSEYSVCDLVPDEEEAEKFRGGLCLVFRLEASDYHHFCCIDSGRTIKSGYVPGILHSVQPIAMRSVPVFRLNRRWWSVLETDHLGTVAQTEIGAVLVGGVSFFTDDGHFLRGQDMGTFEITGSTIVLMLTEDVRKRLELRNDIAEACDEGRETRVSIGTAIGSLAPLNRTEIGL